MKNFKIKDKILFFTVAFVFLFALLIDVCSQEIISRMMEADIYKTINGVCCETSYILKEKYSTDFRIEEEKLIAGDTVLSNELEFLDHLKEHFESEISIFYGNKRYLTTIRGRNGLRITGTVQDNEKIISTVFRGETYQARNVMINGDKYYGVYRPLWNSSNEICGMVFAGISTSSVTNTKIHLLFTILLISAVSCLVGILIVSVFTNRMCMDLYYIRVFLDRLSKNEMDISLNESVLQRHDEIGELGVHSVHISRNITELMNTDPLTHLMNRRSGLQLIKTTCNRNVMDSRPLTFAMGDIDFFKQVNDTYGHAIGDDVLIKISDIIKDMCASPDFAIRWGGEEFLLVMHKTQEETVEVLEQIRTCVEKLDFAAQDKIFRVTITFGVSPFTPGEDSYDTIHRADTNLYKGKESGRNTIISE
ncbi:MAG: diguanylate cyclase [Spirochaetia bacterium]|nr:diguanylate cyclase [Spirochaetia bacterium]